MTEHARAHAEQLLIARLVTRYELTPQQASTAIDQARRNETGPHTELATLEVCALLRWGTAQVRNAIEAVRPLVQAAARTMAELDRALQPVVGQAHAARPDRAAWVSPYGPPRRRRLR